MKKEKLILYFILFVIIAILFRIYIPQILSMYLICGKIGSNDKFKTRIVNSGHDTCVLIPGLGNGIESYNWNLSTDIQRNKHKLPLIYSLQDKIAKETNMTVITFDPPAYGDNINYNIHSIDEYIELIYSLDPNIKLIVGHSIGARIAQMLGEKYNIKYIMLDPTPDYVINEANFIESKQNTEEDFINIVKKDVVKITNTQWNPQSLIYSIDNDNKNKERKEKYFQSINTKERKIKLIDATHWVHISNPDIVLEEIKLSL